MDRRVKDIAGQKFGRLLVIGYAGSENRSAMWSCVCECGTEFVTKAKNLRSGGTRSCGCLHREISAEGCRARLTKHGETAGGNSRVYRIWANMVSRCHNPLSSSYPHYGGRGIKVCQEWRTFSNFLRDMGHPDPSQSIDRFPDNDGDYEPENCRWATQVEQTNNSRKNRYLEINGRRMTLAQWSREPGAVSYGTIHSRLCMGWEPACAVFKQLRSAEHGVGRVDQETGEIAA